MLSLDLNDLAVTTFAVAPQPEPEPEPTPSGMLPTCAGSCSCAIRCPVPYTYDPCIVTS